MILSDAVRRAVAVLVDVLAGRAARARARPEPDVSRAWQLVRPVPVSVHEISWPLIEVRVDEHAGARAPSGSAVTARTDSRRAQRSLAIP